MDTSITDKIQRYIDEAKIIKYINIPKEKVTSKDLKHLEIILDSMFKTYNIDIEFTKHFLDRVNDKRNGKDITIEELQDVFNKTYNKFASKFSHMKNIEAVLHDIQNDINVPFILKYNKKNNMMELVSKTVMRKKNFMTRDRKYNV